jgi:hypothetical protein
VRAARRKRDGCAVKTQPPTILFLRKAASLGLRVMVLATNEMLDHHWFRECDNVKRKKLPVDPGRGRMNHEVGIIIINRGRLIGSVRDRAGTNLVTMRIDFRKGGNGKIRIGPVNAKFKSHGVRLCGLENVRRKVPETSKTIDRSLHVGDTTTIRVGQNVSGSADMGPVDVTLR